MGHLREVVTGPCITCSTLPLSLREERLNQVEGLLFGDDHPPSGLTRRKVEKEAYTSPKEV